MNKKFLGRFIKNTKGITVQNLGAYALAFSVAVIIVSLMAQVLGQIKSNQLTAGCVESALNCSIEHNVTTKGLEGMEDLGDWFPTIATIIAAVVIIVLIVSGFRPSVGGSFQGF